MSNDSTQYTVTTIGTEDGTSVMIYPDTIHFTTLTVEIPGSVNKLYAKALNASNEDVGRRVRVFFKPNNNLKSWPEGMFSGTRFKALKLPQGV